MWRGEESRCTFHQQKKTENFSYTKMDSRDRFMSSIEKRSESVNLTHESADTESEGEVSIWNTRCTSSKWKYLSCKYFLDILNSFLIFVVTLIALNIAPCCEKRGFFLYWNTTLSVVCGIFFFNFIAHYDTIIYF